MSNSLEFYFFIFNDRGGGGVGRLSIAVVGETNFTRQDGVDFFKFY